jgi:hypothetical protein
MSHEPRAISHESRESVPGEQRMPIPSSPLLAFRGDGVRSDLSPHSVGCVGSVELVDPVDSWESWESVKSVDSLARLRGVRGFRPGPLEISLETPSRPSARGTAADFKILDYALAPCIWRIWRTTG